MGIEVEGLDELRRDLKRIGDQGLKDALKAANLRLATDVVAKALPNVPVRTGRLKSTVRGLGNVTGAIGKVGGAAVPYAAVVHWRPGGRPFLTDAAATIESSVADRYLDEIDQLFDAVRAD